MLCRTTAEDVYTVCVCLQTKNITESPVVWDGLVELLSPPVEKKIEAATWRRYIVYGSGITEIKTMSSLTNST